jgi:hypothetical protein
VATIEEGALEERRMRRDFKLDWASSGAAPRNHPQPRDRSAKPG